MLHIILLILKIIGIVLLCVLGILILTIICLLYVPIRYRIEITRQEGEGQPPVAVWMKATWLLHFVNVLVRYPAELRIRVRVMFFTIWRSSDGGDGDEQASGKKKKRSKKKKASAKEESEEAEEKIKETAKENDKSEPLRRREDIQKTTFAEVEGQEEAGTLKEDEEDSEKSPSFTDKLRALPVIIKKIILKIKSLFENIQYTIQGLCDKIKSISDNIQYYKDVVESDTFQNAYGLCKEELTAILKCLKPQKVEGNLIVGMDDPATTGKILSICGMLYPVLGGHVDVAGDFERKRIEGRLFIKGRIRCFTFLRAAVRIYYNKDIKKVHRLLKKEAA